MGGGPQNMNAMIRQAQKMQEYMKAKQVDPEDIEMLQDLIVAAVNEAIRTVEETTNAEMEKITGSLQIPGMM